MRLVMQNLRVFVLRFRPGLSWFGLGVGLSWLLIAPCMRADDWPGPIVRGGVQQEPRLFCADYAGRVGR